MVQNSESAFSQSGDQHKRCRKGKQKKFNELSPNVNDEYHEQNEGITSLRPAIKLEKMSSESEGRWFDLNLSPPDATSPKERH